MSLFTKTGLVPNWAGEFTSYQQWVNKGASWLASPDHRRAVCIDDKGRRVTCGGDFALARDEGAFPVRFFWDCEPQALADPSVASSASADELPPVPVNGYGCRSMDEIFHMGAKAAIAASNQAAPGQDSKLVEDAERWKFMMRVADNEDGPESQAMQKFGNDWMESDRAESDQLVELVDRCRAALAAAGVKE